TVNSPTMRSARSITSAAHSPAQSPLATAMVDRFSIPTENYFRAGSASRPGSATTAAIAAANGVSSSPSARERRVLRKERAADPSLMFAPPSANLSVHTPILSESTSSASQLPYELQASVGRSPPSAAFD